MTTVASQPATWSGELRSIAGDLRSEGAGRMAFKINRAADEIDRTRDALWELLKLFTEIDGGKNARHPAVLAARNVLGLSATGASDGTAGKEAARG